MKRRNFFSKISKGLLGFSIFKALPKQEVLPKASPALDLSLDDTANSPKGIAGDSNRLYIVDTNDDNIAIIGVETDNGFKETSRFNLPPEPKKSGKVIIRSTHKYPTNEV